MSRSIAAAPSEPMAPSGRCSGMSDVSGVAVLVAVTSASQREADEVVENEDARGARHDRRVDRATDAWPAAGRREAEVAARERDDEAEHDALEETVRHVAEAEQARREAVVERLWAHAEERVAGVRCAEQGERIGEERHHE